VERGRILPDGSLMLIHGNLDRQQPEAPPRTKTTGLDV
jgi:hypothetical protein